jgi:hypothetical protein
MRTRPSAHQLRPGPIDSGIDGSVSYGSVGVFNRTLYVSTTLQYLSKFAGPGDEAERQIRRQRSFGNRAPIAPLSAALDAAADSAARAGLLPLWLGRIAVASPLIVAEIKRVPRRCEWRPPTEAGGHGSRILRGLRSVEDGRAFTPGRRPPVSPPRSGFSPGSPYAAVAWARLTMPSRRARLTYDYAGSRRCCSHR